MCKRCNAGVLMQEGHPVAQQLKTKIGEKTRKYVTRYTYDLIILDSLKRRKNQNTRHSMTLEKGITSHVIHVIRIS